MVTMKDIQSIRENLKKCKPADLANNSAKPITNREAVRQLLPTLLKMRERGFTTSALVEVLQQYQITIKGRDLSRYLREFQGERPAEVKVRQPKKPPTPKVKSPTDEHDPPQATSPEQSDQ